MGTVCVEVAVLDDRRLLAALDSLASQRRRPDRVLVAASVASPDELLVAAASHAPVLRVEVVRLPAGIVAARSASLPLLHEEIVAFLDADERAPPEWLGALVAPIERGEAAFTGGPTRPTRAPESSIERYDDLLERSIYEDLVPTSIAYVPLQNTAWRTPLLQGLGFDPRIPYAEDHDLELRALRAGARGLFVPEAWVYHDKSEAGGLGRWARKRYRYLVAMAMSLYKNGELGGRLNEHRRPVRHPLRYLESMMKPVALAHAWIRWRRVRSRPAA